MQFKVNKDRRGEHRFKLVADNGKTIAVTGEGIKNEEDILNTIESIKDDARDAEILFEYPRS